MKYIKISTCPARPVTHYTLVQHLVQRVCIKSNRKAMTKNWMADDSNAGLYNLVLRHIEIAKHSH